MTDFKINPRIWLDCKLWFFAYSICFYLSSIFLVIMSAEKWFAMYFPIKAKSLCTVTMAKRVSMGSILVVTLYNTHWFFLVKAFTNEFGFLDCKISESYEALSRILDAFIAAFIPIVVMLIFNVSIVFKFCKSKSSKSLVNGKSLSKMAKQSTIMLLSVTFVFIVLNLPLHVYLATMGTFDNVNIVAIATAANLLFVNNGINALLYTCSSSKYRKHLWKLIRCGKDNAIASVNATSKGDNPVNNTGQIQTLSECLQVSQSHEHVNSNETDM